MNSLSREQMTNSIKLLCSSMAVLLLPKGSFWKIPLQVTAPSMCSNPWVSNCKWIRQAISSIPNFPSPMKNCLCRMGKWPLVHPALRQSAIKWVSPMTWPISGLPSQWSSSLWASLPYCRPLPEPILAILIENLFSVSSSTCQNSGPSGCFISFFAFLDIGSFSPKQPKTFTSLFPVQVTLFILLSMY